VSTLVPWYDAMTYRRIISPTLLRQQGATIGVTREKERAASEISLFYLIPTVVLVAVTKYNIPVDDYIAISWTFIFVIGTAIFKLVTILLQRKTHGKGIEAIALYPLGIQLGTLVVDGSTLSNHTSTKVKLIPQEFLHRETIVDCVVTELVYSYKVQSAVMLRTKQPTDEIKNAKGNSSLNDGSTKTAPDSNMTDSLTRTRKSRESVNDLIRLFSDVEMSFLECLVIRAHINDYLSHNDEDL
jgi:hypothetical protein